MTTDSVPGWRELSGIYEPSAILQLADGRFLVVEDEKATPFSLARIAVDGSVVATPLSRGALQSGDSLPKLDDLEALALDAAGNVYAITSHSRDGDGDEKKSRERLLRFRVEGDEVRAAVAASGLKAALLAAHPVLAAAAAIRDVKGAGGLNIEALEMTPDQQRLLLGLRSPLPDGRALIAAIDNPAAVFDRGEPPRIAATLTRLDLGGHGIRGMSWLPAAAGYLLIGGPADKGDVQFDLWFWDGSPDAPARRVGVAGLPGLAHAEGICPAVLDGRQYVVIVSDDGSRSEQRAARFLLLEPRQLQIAP